MNEMIRFFCVLAATENDYASRRIVLKNDTHFHLHRNPKLKRILARTIHLRMAQK